MSRRGVSAASTPVTTRNYDWTNCRGTWFTTILLVFVLKMLFSSVPGITSATSWTLTHVTYNIFTFFFFHWLMGAPFDDQDQSVNGHLTLWEQLDGGDQFTPSRKFLTVFPVVLFVVSTHYTNYDLKSLGLNSVVLLVHLIAKLPMMHRVRILGINQKAE